MPMSGRGGLRRGRRAGGGGDVAWADLEAGLAHRVLALLPARERFGAFPLTCKSWLAASHTETIVGGDLFLLLQPQTPLTTNVSCKNTHCPAALLDFPPTHPPTHPHAQAIKARSAAVLAWLQRAAARNQLSRVEGLLPPRCASLFRRWRTSSRTHTCVDELVEPEFAQAMWEHRTACRSLALFTGNATRAVAAAAARTPSDALGACAALERLVIYDYSGTAEDLELLLLTAPNPGALQLCLVYTTSPPALLWSTPPTPTLRAVLRELHLEIYSTFDAASHSTLLPACHALTRAKLNYKHDFWAAHGASMPRTLRRATAGVLVEAGGRALLTTACYTRSPGLLEPPLAPPHPPHPTQGPGTAAGRGGHRPSAARAGAPPPHETGHLLPLPLARHTAAPPPGRRAHGARPPGAHSAGGCAAGACRSKLLLQEAPERAPPARPPLGACLI